MPRLVEVVSRAQRGWVRSAPLLLILTMGAVLRFYGLDWGISSLRDFRLDGRELSVRQAGFHPDSEFLVSATESLRRSIHPHIVVDGQVRVFSSYGPVFMYLHWVSAEVLSVFGGFDPFNLDRVRDTNWTQLSGRVVAALAGVLTLILTMRVGTRLYSREAGLAAAFLLAVTPFHIQSSHFCTVDTLLGLWTTVALLLFWRMVERGRMRDYAWAGGVIGLACATKLYAVILFVPLVAAHLIRWTGEREKTHLSAAPSPSGKGKKRCVSPFGSVKWDGGSDLFFHRRLWTAFGACAGTFVLLAPSSALGFRDYFDPASMLTATSAFRATEGLIFFRGMSHFAGTRPYLYYLTDLFPAGMGLPLEALVFAGIAWGIHRHRREDLLILSFAVSYFLVMGRPQAKYIRYFVPWMPVVALLAGRMLADAWNARQKAVKLAGVFAGLLAFGYTTAYASAFTGVYGEPDARVEAARWISENLPKGSNILVERGHNCLLELISGKDYRRSRLDIEDILALERPDFVVRTGYYRSALYDLYLRRPDYLVISDDRLAARGRLSFATMYYDGLLDGGFGYTLVREFGHSPRLWGLSFDDRDADVTWRQFDHPRMFVFRKEGPARHFDPLYRSALPLKSARQAYETFRYAIKLGDLLLLYGCLPRSVRETATPEGLMDLLRQVGGKPDLLDRLGEQRFAELEPDGIWCIRVYLRPLEGEK